MKTSYTNPWKMTCALLLAGLAVSGWAGVLSGQEKQPTEAPPASDRSSVDRIELEYAETYLKLVQLDYERAVDANRRVASTVTPVLMDQLRHRVTQAQARLKTLKHDPNAAEATLKVMEAESKVAAARLSQAEEANRRAAGAVPALQIERMQLANQLAQLRVERSRSLIDAPAEKQLAWEVEQLREEVDELRSIVMLLRQRN